MARKKNYEKKIVELNEKINKTEKQIDHYKKIKTKLKKELKKIEDEQRQEKAKAIYNKITSYANIENVSEEKIEETFNELLKESKSFNNQERQSNVEQETNGIDQVNQDNLDNF